VGTTGAVLRESDGAGPAARGDAAGLMGAKEAADG